MRIGQLSNSLEKTYPFTRKSYWLGLTLAEIFFPVSGERPRSVVGRKAYEVVLRQPIDDGGQIIRGNVVTTGRVVGVVIAEYIHDTVSVKIRGLVSEEPSVHKGELGPAECGEQPRELGFQAVPHIARRGREDGETSMNASSAATQQ